MQPSSAAPAAAALLLNHGVPLTGFLYHPRGPSRPPSACRGLEEASDEEGAPRRGRRAAAAAAAAEEEASEEALLQEASSDIASRERQAELAGLRK